MTSPPSSWYGRRTLLDELMPELAHILHVHVTGATVDGICHAVSLSSNLDPSAPSNTRHQSASASDKPSLLHILDTARQACLSLADFDPVETLAASGPCARVELASAASTLTGNSKASGQRLYVIKTVDRKWAYRMRHQQSLHDQVRILRMANKEPRKARTPRLLASFLSPDEFHIVCEQAVGGDLWSVLESANTDIKHAPCGLPEPFVKIWAAQLVEALEWLHSKGFAHRDIKPHNLLLDCRNHLLLTDFGSCAPLTNTTIRNSRASAVARKYCQALIGTPDYMAPEVLLHAEKLAREAALSDREDGGGSFEMPPADPEEKAYGAEVDWWSLGIVVYELLFGQAPFFAESIADTYRRILKHKTHLAFPSSPTVSPSALGFIKS
ncbi:hypothetical protein OIV83_003710 [Microbotryomycetes sp. JL201]|nr:hypothetical protein OIV83_003710 [Microbotryomycetes sp. JL201]